MSLHVEAEIASQPDCWSTAVDRAARVADRLPRAGERVAFVGCGTSWFVAQVVAHWRESRGLGETDAYTASEVLDRPYDRVVALTRSGTTTEVLEVLSRLRGRVPTVAVTGDLSTPVVDLADEVVDLSFADEKSVVQTRFATSTLALFRSLLGDDLAPLIEAAGRAVSRSAAGGPARRRGDHLPRP